jgi:hypothetical protein
VCGQLHAPAAVPTERESSWCPMDRRLRGPESLSGRCEEGIKPRFFAHPVRDLAAVPAELTLLLDSWLETHDMGTGTCI